PPLHEPPRRRRPAGRRTKAASPPPLGRGPDRVRLRSRPLTPTRRSVRTPSSGLQSKERPRRGPALQPAAGPRPPIQARSPKPHRRHPDANLVQPESSGGVRRRNRGPGPPSPPPPADGFGIAPAPRRSSASKKGPTPAGGGYAGFRWLGGAMHTDLATQLGSGRWRSSPRSNQSYRRRKAAPPPPSPASCLRRTGGDNARIWRGPPARRRLPTGRTPGPSRLAVRE